MRIKIFVEQHEVIPRFYGYAWQEYILGRIVVMPVPLNILVRWFIEIRWWVINPTPNKREEALRKEYHRGYADGNASRISGSRHLV